MSVLGLTISLSADSLPLGGAAATGRHGHGESVDRHSVGTTEANRAGDYWTPDRMRAAVDATKPAVPNSAPTSPVAQPSPTGKPYSVAGAPPVGRRVRHAQPDMASRSHADRPYPFTAWNPDSTAWPYSTVGRLFFTGKDERGVEREFFCSGSAVVSANKSTVDTAGHCLYDRKHKEWRKDWKFCPAYHNGNCPHGTWVSKAVFAHSEPFSSCGDLVVL
ncbi:hypothetical protein JOF56_010013 [Kibdelosporangium banguiense]|uniref:Serine protease n=1 Tax=Kibdelosporangium banguiense TaxID=1365924 RepID=A0ABS4TZ06_9PSEU|nr:hypothetical protein [Kibdelosporangium banguiense]MBP2329628.1 hypothetical protein [Kibdelosporangium banguiense]